MHKALLIAVALVAGATLPAYADFQGDCKAHPPREAAGDAAGVETFCACVDKDADDAIRAEFAKTWSMPEVASRRAAMNTAANALADKCAPPRP